MFAAALLTHWLLSQLFCQRVAAPGLLGEVYNWVADQLMPLASCYQPYSDKYPLETLATVHTVHISTLHTVHISTYNGCAKLLG